MVEEKISPGKTFIILYYRVCFFLKLKIKFEVGQICCLRNAAFR